MARVKVRLPSLLVSLVDDDAVAVEADTVEGALAALVERHPALRVHLFDESGALRRHVLCFHNEENTPWATARGVRLADEDTLRILQAVSGG